MSDWPENYPRAELPEPLTANRRYASWLTFAVLLVLATVTVVIVLIIISSSRAERREQEFQATLTAVFDQFAQVQPTAEVTPTPAPAVTFGAYAFEPAPGDPVYTGEPACQDQRIGGQVLDQDGQPTDAFVVWVWGDYTPTQVVFTGALGEQPNGRWEITLDGVIARRVWVQLGAGNRYFSPPVEVIFNHDDCAHSRAEITLVQVGPLN